MPESEAVTLARTQIDAFTASDWAKAKQALAPGTVYDELATGRRIQGADQVVQALQGWKQAFPDAKGTITSAMASGSTAVVEITWQGTHKGPLMSPEGTLPPSGKPVTVRAVQVVTAEGGKIRETRHYFDMVSLMRQIGAAA